MSKSVDIIGYPFSAADKLLFDANIWLYIYGPQGNPNDPKISTYSRAFNNAIKANSHLLVDVLIVSEFINRFARMEYYIYYPTKAPRPEFKQYRNSPAFIPVAKAIIDALRKILKYASRIDNNFSGVDIDALMNEYENGGHDFNDQILIRLCQSHNLKLVTHDSDFKGKNVDILTSNPMILI